jgi:hypothetical protein
VRQPTCGKLTSVRSVAIDRIVPEYCNFSRRSLSGDYTVGVMKRITISLDVPDEDHENVLRLLEGCANRIAYNHPRIGAIRWLDDSVVKPKLVPLRSNASTFEQTAN